MKNAELIYDDNNGKECVVRIPNKAKVTITESCGKCDFRIMASCGNKPVCGHPRIMCIHPYSVDRAIILDTFPEWCPL